MARDAIASDTLGETGIVARRRKCVSCGHEKRIGENANRDRSGMSARIPTFSRMT